MVRTGVGSAGSPSFRVDPEPIEGNTVGGFPVGPLELEKNDLKALLSMKEGLNRFYPKRGFMYPKQGFMPTAGRARSLGDRADAGQ